MILLAEPQMQSFRQTQVIFMRKASVFWHILEVCEGNMNADHPAGSLLWLWKVDSSEKTLPSFHLLLQQRLWGKATFKTSGLCLLLHEHPIILVFYFYCMFNFSATALSNMIEHAAQSLAF